MCERRNEIGILKNRDLSVCGQLKDNPKGRRRRMKEKRKTKFGVLRLRSSLPKTHSALAAFFFSCVQL